MAPNEQNITTLCIFYKVMPLFYHFLAQLAELIVWLVKSCLCAKLLTVVSGVAQIIVETLVATCNRAGECIGDPGIFSGHSLDSQYIHDISSVRTVTMYICEIHAAVMEAL